MCGIAGLKGRLDEAAIRRALGALSHRGPDDEGVHLDPAGVVLGHRRLAVVDLSVTGHQPMVDEESGLGIVFNGEIYEHARLREELGVSRFRGTSDTEVLLRGYERYGIDGLLERIDGMFAFAIWDRRDGTLHLARDHFGKKPLYFAQEGGAFAFASTLPALLELLQKSPELDEDSLAALLTLMYVPGSRTMFRGVHRLAPGTRMSVDAKGAIVERRFFEPRLGPFASRSAEELEYELERKLEAAVKRRLVADVPIGAFLSGGIDSSLVVAMMARSGARVRTLSMAFDDPARDESEYARAVAAHFGTEHQELRLSSDGFAALPALVHRSGEPLADHALVPTYLLALEAKKELSVVLTGDGGDELFGGYEHTRAMALASALPSWPLDRVARTLRDRSPGWSERFALLAAYAGPTYHVDPTGKRAFRAELDALLSPTFAIRLDPKSIDREHDEAWARYSELGRVDRAMNVDLVTLLPGAFLHKLDAATMGAGLEARSPFLDTKLFELARTIPWTSKLGRFETKHPLRGLARKLLPRSITERAKRGFSPPTGAWLMGNDAGATLETLLLSEGGLDSRVVRASFVKKLLDEQRSGRVDNGQRLFALLVADLFLRLFVDRTLKPSDDLRKFARELGRS